MELTVGNDVSMIRAAPKFLESRTVSLWRFYAQLQFRVFTRSRSRGLGFGEATTTWHSEASRMYYPT